MSIKKLKTVDEPSEKDTEDDDDFFRIEFHISKFVEREAEDITGNDFIRGNILKVLNGDELDPVVGTIELFLFRLDIAMQDQLDFFDVFDSTNEEAGRLYSVLFDGRTREFKQDIEEEFFPDIYINKVLYIHEFELQSAFRGKKLGKKVVQRVIETFTDFGTITTTKPFPLQWVGKGHGMSKQKKIDMKKVISFWEDLGFQRIRKSDFFIFSS